MFDQARIKRRRDDIFRAEVAGLAPVSGGHFIRHRHACQRCDGIGGGQLHLLVYGGCPHVQRAPEQIGEAQHVVDLIGIIAAAGGNDGIAAHLVHFFRGDFRIGVGHRKDDGIGGHAGHHLGAHGTLLAQAHEHVRAHHRLFQGARWRIGGMRRFPLVHALFAALVDHARRVTHDDMLDAIELDQLGAGNRRGPGAVHHHLHIGRVAPGQMHCVDQASRGHDGGAVLIIVKDRNIHPFLQRGFDDEAFRRLDILKVDAAERRLQQFHAGDELVDVLGVHFQIDAVDIGKALEQHRLAFHHRL